MSQLRRVDDVLYVHFAPFLRYHGRRLLDHHHAKRMLLEILTDELQTLESRAGRPGGEADRMAVGFGEWVF